MIEKLSCRPPFKSLKRGAPHLHSNTDPLQTAVILKAHTAALEEIYQRRKSFPAVAGARRDDADEFAQGIAIPVYLAVSIFHGVRNSYNH